MHAELLPEDVKSVDVLSGMSGGPILVNCGDRWGLAGIVSEGHDLNSFAKSDGQGFFQGPAINIAGETLILSELRSWLDSLKRRSSQRPTRHIRITTQ